MTIKEALKQRILLDSKELIRLIELDHSPTNILAKTHTIASLLIGLYIDESDWDKTIEATAKLTKKSLQELKDLIINSIKEGNL